MTAFAFALCLLLGLTSIAAAAKKVKHNTKGQIDVCSQTFPINGTFVSDPDDPDARPEQKNLVFRPSNCYFWRFSNEDKEQCLKGRRIDALGNSVIRHYAFELAKSISDDPRYANVSRQDEKQLCPKQGTFGKNPGCEMHLNSDILVRSSWFLYFDGLPPGKNMWKKSSIPYWDSDRCGKGDVGTMECMREMGIFNSTERDVIMFNMGIIYLYVDPEPATLGSFPNKEEWMKDAVRKFVRGVAQNFKGQVVYMDVAPMQHGDQHLAPIYPRAEEFNRMMRELILVELADLTQKWLKYDSWSINNQVLNLHHFYDDAFHHHGYLTKLGWDVILSGLCPKDSLDTAVKPTEATHAVARSLRGRS